MFREPARDVPTFPLPATSTPITTAVPPWPEPKEARCLRLRARRCTEATMSDQMRPNSPRQRAIRKALTALVPHAPYADMVAIFDAARRRRLRDLAPPAAAFLATVAHVRHQHTDYDELRDDGYDHDSARHFVLDDINDVLTSWGGTRLVSGDETERPGAGEPVTDETGADDPLD